MADGSGDRGPVCYTVEIETRTGIDLIDEATNHIYLTLPLDGNDMVDIAVLPAGDAPPQPFLKLGTVDATTDVTVSITGTNEPVEEGDTLTVDYEATNDGTIQDTQDIELEVQ